MPFCLRHECRHVEIGICCHGVQYGLTPSPKFYVMLSSSSGETRLEVEVI